jgi:carbamoyl-phosphate synthase large subunit
MLADWQEFTPDYDAAAQRAGKVENHTLELDHVGIKPPMFSFAGLVEVPIPCSASRWRAPERSAVSAWAYTKRCFMAWATGVHHPCKGGLLSLAPVADKYYFANEARILADELSLPLYGTQGTAER